MRLVGATDGFIKAPFYIESIIQGILGGVTGMLVLYAIFLTITSNVKQDFSAGIFNLRFLPVGMTLGIIFGSMFAGWVGCYLSLKQFLKT